MTTERVLILCILLTLAGCASGGQMSVPPAPGAPLQVLLNSTQRVGEFNDWVRQNTVRVAVYVLTVVGVYLLARGLIQTLR